MRILAATLIGALIGSILTYGLLPFPRVVWDGNISGEIDGATLDCIGIAARHGAYVKMGTIALPVHRYPCQGFLRPGNFCMIAKNCSQL